MFDLIQRRLGRILMIERLFQLSLRGNNVSIEKRIIRLERNGPNGAGLPEIECNPAGFQSPVPTQHMHVYYDDPKIGLNVGIWDTTTMREAFGPYPGDEFVWILEGEFKMIHDNGEEVLVHENECAYFRNGIPTCWHQEGYLRKFYIIYLDPNAETPKIESAEDGVRVLDPDVEMAPMDTTDPFEVEGAMPEQKNHTIFTNDAGNFHVGTWESGPMVSKMLPFPTHEFVRMLEGEVTITEEDGTAHTFRDGDCFFVPKGTVCSWTIKIHVKKHYAILDL